MVAVAYSILWILAVWKWGDWENWKKYYPTMLFAIVGNLLYEVICFNYPMWAMEPNGLPNQTIPILLLVLVGMPLSVFVFLSHFPDNESKIRQALYILLFVCIFVVLEYVSVQLGSITYHNGWNLAWSSLFNVIMFSIIRIHYKKPILALILSAIFIGILSTIFDVSLDKMK
ncbi:CBO0543 family protein [Peribacillus alkalitolerans]|uniref:CBO0543 family protein n=1 Tax=Peribacillus alkalitolerans TaxID=1550385 RepID=UPI0013D0DB7C|nr:CBO0543 family protein [Peribacillus alkalitolerans]